MQSEEFQAVGYCREIESERAGERDSGEGELFWKEVIMGRLGTPSVWYPWENGLRTLSPGGFGMCVWGGLYRLGIRGLGGYMRTRPSTPLSWVRSLMDNMDFWESLQGHCVWHWFAEGLAHCCWPGASSCEEDPAVDLSDASVFLSLTVYWTCSQPYLESAFNLQIHLECH